MDDPDDDTDLLERFRDGDERALEAEVDRLLDALS